MKSFLVLITIYLLFCTFATCSGKSDFEKLYPKSEEEKERDRNKSVRQKLYDDKIELKPIKLTNSNSNLTQTANATELQKLQTSPYKLEVSQLAIVLFLFVVAFGFSFLRCSKRKKAPEIVVNIVKQTTSEEKKSSESKKEMEQEKEEIEKEEIIPRSVPNFDSEDPVTEIPEPKQDVSDEENETPINKKEIENIEKVEEKTKNDEKIEEKIQNDEKIEKEEKMELKTGEIITVKQEIIEEKSKSIISAKIHRRRPIQKEEKEQTPEQIRNTALQRTNDLMNLINPENLEERDKLKLFRTHVKMVEVMQGDKNAEQVIQLELYKEDQIFLSNLATSTTLIVMLVWSLFLKNIVYDVGWLEVKEWWLVVLEKPFKGSWYTWLANPGDFVVELLSMLSSVLFMLFTPLFLVIISLKSPRFGLFVAIGVVFHVFWQSFLRMAIWCCLLYSVEYISVWRLSTRYRTISTMRGITKLVIMGLSVGISFVIGVIVAQGDPRNPFREITVLEQFIERIFTNSLRPI